jgi:hypothetical protein
LSTIERPITVLRSSATAALGRPSGPKVAATRIVSLPSGTMMSTIRASQMRAARCATASNTGCTSDGELEITRRMSLIAVCCSSDSLVSLNRRAFSIAITAWSAKALISATCLPSKAKASLRAVTMAPITDPSRNIGAAMIALYPP